MVEHSWITYRTETDTDPERQYTADRCDRSYKHTVPSRLDMPFPCKPELMPFSPLCRRTQAVQKFDSARVPVKHGLL